jgi:hypothetical protein
MFGSLEGEEIQGKRGKGRRGEERGGEWLPLPLIWLF